MAYFSKEVYDKKRDYARNVANEGLENIALYLLASDEESESYSNDELEEYMDDLIYELEPIKELSFARHSMHTSSVFDNEDIELIGTVYSTEETLIDQVNKLNDKYNLVDWNLKLLDEPMISEDTYEDSDIADYFDIDEDEITDDMTYEYIEHLEEEWKNAKDKASAYIRSWFKELNKKFDTDFPD